MQKFKLLQKLPHSQPFLVKTCIIFHFIQLFTCLSSFSVKNIPKFLPCLFPFFPSPSQTFKTTSLYIISISKKPPRISN